MHEAVLCGKISFDRKISAGQWTGRRTEGKMASNKSSMTRAAGQVKRGLGSALLTIIGVGAAGGTVLVYGAKAIGEKMLSKQESDEKKLEERREADKEVVRQIMESEGE